MVDLGRRTPSKYFAGPGGGYRRSTVSGHGVAGAPDDVPAETDTEILDRYTAAVLGQWRAWAVGDTFSWRFTDLTGGEVELGWGYYGCWSSDSDDGTRQPE